MSWVRGEETVLSIPFCPGADPEGGAALETPLPSYPIPLGGDGGVGWGRGVGLTPHPPLPLTPAFSFLLLNVKCKNNFYIFYFFSLLFQEEQPRFQSAVRLLLSISFSFPFNSGLFWGRREKEIVLLLLML